MIGNGNIFNIWIENSQQHDYVTIENHLNSPLPHWTFSSRMLDKYQSLETEQELVKKEIV